MDLLLALAVIIVAYLVFKSLLGVLIALLVVAVALYVVRSGPTRRL